MGKTLIYEYPAILHERQRLARIGAKTVQKNWFNIGLLVGIAWMLSVWVGGWMIFLFAPEAYDMLNDTVGLPIDEWIHVTFKR